MMKLSGIDIETCAQLLHRWNRQWPKTTCRLNSV